MSDFDEPRWILRLENFTKALSELSNACNLAEYSDLERAGLVKTFEFSFELAWNTLGDLLSYEGIDEKVPRSIIRKSFEIGYLSEGDCETLLDALNKRNLLSHTYEKELAFKAESLIKDRYQPSLSRLEATLTSKKLS